MKHTRPLTSSQHASKPRIVDRCGMAALEVVMIIGGVMPIAVGLLFLVREAMRYYYSMIANIAGSPVL